MSGQDQRLQIRILRMLASARREEAGGAAGKQLRDSLDLESVVQLETPLRCLNEKGYVDAIFAKRVFVITDRGLDYLADLGSDWPQSALVPRRPLPTAGAREIALALPEPDADVA